MAEQPKEKKIVWIACRAKDGCQSNQAEIVMSRSHFAGGGGGFEPSQGGRMTRYRCQTCNGTFTIST